MNHRHTIHKLRHTFSHTSAHHPHSSSLSPARSHVSTPHAEGVLAPGIEQATVTSSLLRSGRASWAIGRSFRAFRGIARRDQTLASWTRMIQSVCPGRDDGAEGESYRGSRARSCSALLLRPAAREDCSFADRCGVFPSCQDPGVLESHGCRGPGKSTPRHVRASGQGGVCPIFLTSSEMAWRMYVKVGLEVRGR